tara:strand:- start:7691 stop:7864 length:174 start_codon:yes stop_codon:yes gene_type:complete
MKFAIFEIVYLAVCFIAIMVAGFLTLNDYYQESFYILGYTLLALLIYIIIKLIKKFS